MTPDHYMEIHYESLVSQPVYSLRRIRDFLGEEFEAEMLRYHEDAETRMPPMSMRWHKSSVSATDPTKVQSWWTQMCSGDRIVFEKIAGDALKRFSYELNCMPPTLGSRLRFVQCVLLGHA